MGRQWWSRVTGDWAAEARAQRRPVLMGVVRGRLSSAVSGAARTRRAALWHVPHNGKEPQESECWRRLPARAALLLPEATTEYIPPPPRDVTKPFRVAS